MVIVADLLRAVVVAVLCVTIVTGHVVDRRSCWSTMFLYGVAEVFADTTTGTLLPMLVGKRRPRHRATPGCRPASSPPTSSSARRVGAFLFAAGMVVAVRRAGRLRRRSGVVLVARIATPRGGVRGVPDTHVRRDIADGLRWIRRPRAGAHAGAGHLRVQHHLGRGLVGAGALLARPAAHGRGRASACSPPRRPPVGWSAPASYGWLERRIPLATLMRGCLLLEVLTHLALALTTVGWLAIAIMVVFGAYAFVWGTVSQTVRQRAVPQEFQGRVGSVYVVGLFLGLVVGQGLGGVIAEQWGLAAPFWFAFVGSGITLALVWRQLGHIAHADEAQPGGSARHPG